MLDIVQHQLFGKSRGKFQRDSERLEDLANCAKLCATLFASLGVQTTFNMGRLSKERRMSSITVPRSERISSELLICLTTEDASPSSMKLGIIKVLASDTASLAARASARSALVWIGILLHQPAINWP